MLDQLPAQGGSFSSDSPPIATDHQLRVYMIYIYSERDRERLYISIYDIFENIYINIVIYIIYIIIYVYI